MNAGDVVLVRFPFATLDAAKKRPALVLWETAVPSRERLATVAMITSRVDGLALPGDVRLLDWAAAGLLHPSLVRLAKVATLDAPLLERTLGRLEAADRAAVGSAVASLLRSWPDR